MSSQRTKRRKKNVNDGGDADAGIQRSEIERLLKLTKEKEAAAESLVKRMKDERARLEKALQHLHSISATSIATNANIPSVRSDEEVDDNDNSDDSNDNIHVQEKGEEGQSDQLTSTHEQDSTYNNENEEEQRAPQVEAPQAPVNDFVQSREFPIDIDVAYPWWKEGKSMYIDETWGLVPSANTAKRYKDEFGQELALAAQKLTTQIRGWKPTYDTSKEPWHAFYISPKLLEEYGVDNSDPTTALKAVFEIDDSQKDAAGHPYVTVHSDVLVHKRQTFFPQRFYFFNGGVNKKRLAKIRAATNAFKAQTVKGTAIRVTFENEYMCIFHWGILLAAQAKKWPGALFCLSFTDGSEKHYHHGK